MIRSSVLVDVTVTDNGTITGQPRGFVLAGTASNSGKTVLSLGLIRALQDHGLIVGAAKCGPDYIDPRFLAAASGSPVFNLDSWAMNRDRQFALAKRAFAGCNMVVVEGVMGLFDGASGSRGSTESLASNLGLPIILAIPADGTAQSTAATATGFAAMAKNPGIVGAIVTRTASERHESLIREGFERTTVPLLGFFRRTPNLGLKSRHLGLVQAEEVDELEALIDRAASAVRSGVDLDVLIAQTLPPSSKQASSGQRAVTLMPLGQRIAVARDVAFAFSYPHMLADWRSMGAEISFFSPLADEAPSDDCDAVFLPGGYPELHAGRLSDNRYFLGGLRHAAEKSALIYGECGGYMVLGDVLKDADGVLHEMAGLLPVETSFEDRKLHLGYRHLSPKTKRPWPMDLSGHEFHYASLVREDLSQAEPLFETRDAAGKSLGTAGLSKGTVMGSFAHVIDAFQPD